MTIPWSLEEFKLLHQCNDNAVELSNIERVSTLFPERVNLIKNKDTGGSRREAEQFSKVYCSLTKISTDNRIESYDIVGQREFISYCLCRKTLSATRRTNEKQLCPATDAFRRQVSAMLGFFDQIELVRNGNPNAT